MVRHRLNRAGDRALNSALHMIAITRMTHHPETHDYVEKRRAEGKTDKEIRRCLKRYLPGAFSGFWLLQFQGKLMETRLDRHRRVKGQLNLEQHGGRTPSGVATRVIP